MGQVTATATTTVAAPPEDVLEFLRNAADRPRILTGNYSRWTVGEDGVRSFHFAAARRERDYRLTPSERDGVLTESDELSSFVNTWSVVAAGPGSSVTLTATWQGATGIGGFFEGLFAPLGLKKIYAEILGNLAATLRK